MVDAHLETVALPILEELEKEIETFRLEEWEDNDVVAVPLGLLYRCLKQQDLDPTRRQNLYLRICRLDPLQAITFGHP
jgi:type VI secretion system protein ImpA